MAVSAFDAFVRPLTTREREVTDLVVQGWSNREIARSLVVSEETVKTHVKIVFEKLVVSSRAELAAVYWQAQLADAREVQACPCLAF